MQFKTVMKLNSRTTVEMNVDAKDLEEAIGHAAPLLDFDGRCGLCASENIKLNTRTSKDKKYTYTQYTCLDCEATRPFGKLQTGGFFLKPWQKKYEGTDNQ
jgi:hypothetical protein